MAYFRHSSRFGRNSSIADMVAAYIQYQPRLLPKPMPVSHAGLWERPNYINATVYRI